MPRGVYGLYLVPSGVHLNKHVGLLRTGEWELLILTAPEIVTGGGVGSATVPKAVANGMCQAL